MKIGELAERAGVTVDTIRFYEREGLVEPDSRTASGYRRYSPEALRRLSFIRRARELGFTLQEIRELLALSADRRADASRVRERAVQKLADLEERIRDLERMRRSLQELVACCGGSGVTRDRCPILEALETNIPEAPPAPGPNAGG